jgi:tetratricopeptide (TPR) repeat protein
MNPSPNCQVTALILARSADGLTETIASAKQVADEVLIGDASTGTQVKSVVSEAGGRVVDIPWTNDFAAARNALVTHANGDWNLWLEPGETVAAEDCAEMKKLLCGGGLAADRAYMMLVKIPAEPGNVAGEQVARIRLLPNLPEISYSGRVRECVTASLDTLHLEIDGLPFRILRSTAEHDSNRQIQRARRNVEMADLAVREVEPQPRLLNCLADAFQTLGELETSKKFYEQALSLSEDAPEQRLEAWYGLLTTMQLLDPTPDKLLPVVLEALEQFPLDKQLLCAMGGYLQNQRRFELAARAYETAVRYGKVDPRIWHLDELDEVALVCLAAALKADGKIEQAMRELATALADQPEFGRARRQLLDMLIEQGQQDAAIEVVDDLPDKSRDTEQLKLAVRGACLAAGENWTAAKSYLLAAYKAGCHDVLCLRWLSMVTMALEDTTEAVSYLQQWRQAEPHNAEPARYLAAIKAENKEATAGRRVDAPQSSQTRPDLPIAGTLPQQSPTQLS